jgi:MFS-type transporter involved in bile tolerance (Atg22 family)
MPKTSFSHLFAQRQFMRFWVARLAGVTANQMLMVAVAWHMYDINSSAWDLGLVGLLMTLPAGPAGFGMPQARWPCPWC